MDYWGHLGGLIRRSSAIVLGVGVVITASGWLVLAIAEDLVAEHYLTPLRLAALCVPFVTLIALLSGVSRGFGWVGLAYTPQLIFVPGLILLGSALFATFVGTPTAIAVLLIAISACSITALAHVIRFRRTVPHQVRQTEPVYETRLWLRVAIPLFVSDGVFLVLWSTDTVMLGNLMTPEDVSIYHALSGRPA